MSDGKIEGWPNRTRELIDELLAQGPAAMRQQMTEILRKQQDAGIWK